MPVAPPPPKGPPLNALRAFEAAARLGGFVQAAQALHVTPAAIAAHIKTLERYVGQSLFERHAQGVRLTPLGAEVLPGFEAAFDALAQATQRLRQSAQSATVHIATSPAIAALWLPPRLRALRAQHPHIAVSITALEQAPERKRSPYDLQLFFSRQHSGQSLGSNDIVPVCSPQLAAQLQTPGDLAQAVCLTDTAWASDWSLWWQHVHQRKPQAMPTLRGPRYSLYSLAVQEALNGVGVLMGHVALLQPWLNTGQLVTPLLPALSLRETMRISAPAAGRSRAVALIHDGLIALADWTRLPPSVAA